MIYSSTWHTAVETCTTVLASVLKVWACIPLDSILSNKMRWLTISNALEASMKQAYQCSYKLVVWGSAPSYCIYGSYPMTMNDEFTSVVALWSLQIYHNNLKVYLSCSLILTSIAWRPDSCERGYPVVATVENSWLGSLGKFSCCRVSKDGNVLKWYSTNTCLRYTRSH